MARKKQKKPKAVQDAAALSRINFLHQAAHIVPLPLQRHYLATSRVVMKKTMLKLYRGRDNKTNSSDPNLKRLTCRRCSALLSPQTGNVTTRLAEATNDVLEIECRHCGTKRRFNITEAFSLYSERQPVEITQIR